MEEVMRGSEPVPGDAWVFCPEEIHSVDDFVGTLPAHFRELLVDEWDGDAWHFVFGDDRDHISAGLTRLKEGTPFRVRLG
jgi:hypothetical protein